MTEKREQISQRDIDRQGKLHHRAEQKQFKYWLRAYDAYEQLESCLEDIEQRVPDFPWTRDELLEQFARLRSEDIEMKRDRWSYLVRMIRNLIS